MVKKKENETLILFHALANRALSKLFSGRFISTVLIITTYCVLLIKSLDLVVDGKMSKEFFMGIFTGFSTLAGGIIAFYFTRADRKATNDNEENGKK